MNFLTTLKNEKVIDFVDVSYKIRKFYEVGEASAKNVAQ